MTAAAQSNMKRPYLELGGKGANIVFPDADLDKAAAAAAWAVTYNAGQMCTAGARLVVHESVKDDVLAKVLEAMAAAQPANPLDHDAPIGAVASARQLDTIHGIVTEGLGEGGRLLMGGRAGAHGDRRLLLPAHRRRRPAARLPAGAEGGLRPGAVRPDVLVGRRGDPDRQRHRTTGSRPPCGRTT